MVRTMQLELDAPSSLSAAHAFLLLCLFDSLPPVRNSTYSARMSPENTHKLIGF